MKKNFLIKFLTCLVLAVTGCSNDKNLSINIKESEYSNIESNKHKKVSKTNQKKHTSIEIKNLNKLSDSINQEEPEHINQLKINSQRSDVTLNDYNKLSLSDKLTKKEIDERFKADQFKIFDFDVNADGINDILISRVYGVLNLYQGDELYVLLGDKKGRYTLSLSTSNQNSDGGYHSYDILPRPNHNGFIIHTLFPDRGYNFIDYYTEYTNNIWMLDKVSFHGVVNNEEQQNYNCIVAQNVHLTDDYTIKNGLTTGSDDVLKERCPAPTTKYTVKSEKAEILTSDFYHRDPPNYYIKGDIIEADDQNEDWVKVSYKNNTKVGWIDKGDLKPIY